MRDTLVAALRRSIRGPFFALALNSLLVFGCGGSDENRATAAHTTGGTRAGTSSGTGTQRIASGGSGALGGTPAHANATTSSPPLAGGTPNSGGTSSAPSHSSGGETAQPTMSGGTSAGPSAGGTTSTNVGAGGTNTSMSGSSSTEATADNGGGSAAGGASTTGGSASAGSSALSSLGGTEATLGTGGAPPIGGTNAGGGIPASGGSSVLSGLGGTEATLGEGGAPTIGGAHSTGGILASGGSGAQSSALTSLEIDPPLLTRPAGSQFRLEALEFFSDEPTRAVRAGDTRFVPVTWSSLDTRTATVSDSGDVKAIAPGIVNIVATEPGSGLSNATVVTVTDAVLVQIQVTPPSATIPDGTRLDFSATGIYSDSTKQDLTDTVTWSSDNAAVATLVDNRATAHGPGNATITATEEDTGLSASAALTVSAAVLTSISITPPESVIAAGNSQPLTATGTFSDGTTKDLSESVIWSLSNPLVASISSGGVALSLAPGNTSVTATDPTSGRFGIAGLAVTDATLVNIQLTPANASTPAGVAVPFLAMGEYTDRSTHDITNQVYWSSSQPSVAWVSNTRPTTGVATTLAPGSTTITATDPVTSLSVSGALTVTDAVLTEIQVTPGVVIIASGSFQQFVATGIYSDSSMRDLTAIAAWDSTNPETATLSNAAGTAGLATSKAKGSTLVTATASDITGSATLTITDAVLTAIEVGGPMVIASGTSAQFTATGIYSDQSTKDLTSAVSWSSAASAVATITASGVVTGVNIGTVPLSATHGVIVGSQELIVTAATLVTLELAPLNATVLRQASQPFTATGFYSDGTKQDLTLNASWTSSATAIATVSSIGIATGVAAGRANISATFGGKTVGAEITVINPTLELIQVTPTSASVPIGSQQQFTATGVYSDGSTADLTDVVTWTSSGSAVATISNAPGFQGLATTTAVGSTTITAKDSSSAVEGSTILAVNNATLVSISVLPTNANLPSGYTLQYRANATYSNGQVRDVTQYVSWSSSSSSTATISNANKKRGLVTAKSKGLTTISALDANSGVLGSTGLTVSQATMTSMELSPVSPSLPEKMALQFVAMGHFSDGTSLIVTSAVTWSSSNTAVASISNANNSVGVAASRSIGSTTISAMDPASGRVASTTLSVTSASLVSISISPQSGPLEVGSTLQMQATATFSDASALDATSQVTWSMLNSAIASVANNAASKGLVTGLSSGTTTVRATYPGTSVTGSASITVTP